MSFHYWEILKSSFIEEIFKSSSLVNFSTITTKNNLREVVIYNMVPVDLELVYLGVYIYRWKIQYLILRPIIQLQKSREYEISVILHSKTKVTKQMMWK